MKRLRKHDQSKNIRFYAVGEYGSKTFRPHYHAIIFNVLDANNYIKSWNYGRLSVDEVTTASIHYVTKYVINRFDHSNDNLLPPFALMSRNPGIGRNYVNKTARFHRKARKLSVMHDGVKIKMPRYIREKIFSKIEIEAMILERQNAADQYEIEQTKKMAESGKNYHLEQLMVKVAKNHLVKKYSKCKF